MIDEPMLPALAWTDPTACNLIPIPELRELSEMVEAALIRRAQRDNVGLHALQGI
jgi:hypothetical protein